MPFINVKTNKNLSGDTMEKLEKAIDNAVSVNLGKPVSYIMTDIETGHNMWFAGSSEPAVMVDISIFGKANPTAYEKLTAQICTIVENTISVPSNRVYVKYSETLNWGFNGFNF